MRAPAPGRRARDADPAPPAGRDPRRARDHAEARRRERGRSSSATSATCRSPWTTASWTARSARDFLRPRRAAAVPRRVAPPKGRPRDRRNPAAGARRRRSRHRHGAEIPDADLRALYRHMLKMRTLDQRMLSLQRQGRIGFYGLATGQAAITGSATAARDRLDLPALRETGVSLWRGTTVHRARLPAHRQRGRPLIGRQMPMHFSDRKVNSVAWSERDRHAARATRYGRPRGRREDRRTT